MCNGVGEIRVVSVGGLGSGELGSGIGVGRVGVGEVGVPNRDNNPPTFSKRPTPTPLHTFRVKSSSRQIAMYPLAHWYETKWPAIANRFVTPGLDNNGYSRRV